MTSIATKTGDAGTTALPGGARLSKADLQVETYGTVDELNAFLGFARSICQQQDICEWTEHIQRTLFLVGASLSMPAAAIKKSSGVTTDDVEYLTNLVYQVEATDGILKDWSLPGANRESAAYELARTVCRRAERLAVRLAQTDTDISAAEPIAYLNRLSDLIWLFGRLIEVRAGIDARLRTDAKPGPNFSRAW